MFKTFLVGVLLGIAAAAGALYAVPLVDQQREISYITVAPNGGNRETFHINIPDDRVMAGTAGESSGVPAGLEWPTDEIFSGVSAEMFKLRNERDVVIGVAARTVAIEDTSQSIEWLVHIPARGSFFLNMDVASGEAGYRDGRLLGGTQEFQKLRGSVAERWLPDASGEEDAPDGRIELLASYIAELEPVE